jgi:hypothetical protein
MEEKIISAMDYARREKVSSVTDRIRKIYQKKFDKGEMDVPIKTDVKGKPVYAEINFGQWLAKCPDCPGAEAVAPEDPVFYCFSCGNFTNNGHFRQVIFPATRTRKAIEAEVLRRPVEIKAGTHTIERLTLAKPLIRTEKGLLSRSWTPDEELETLRQQNKDIKAGE